MAHQKHFFRKRLRRQAITVDCHQMAFHILLHHGNRQVRELPRERPVMVPLDGNQLSIRAQRTQRVFDVHAFFVARSRCMYDVTHEDQLARAKFTAHGGQLLERLRIRQRSQFPFTPLREPVAQVKISYK